MILLLVPLAPQFPSFGEIDQILRPTTDEMLVADKKIYSLFSFRSYLYEATSCLSARL